MKKVKLFIDNILIYGLGGVINKIFPIIMLPIITRLMPNTLYFGLNDLQTTIVSFAEAFAQMGIYDALYRLFFDKDDKSFKKDTCSTALYFVVVSSSCIGLLIVAFKNVIAVNVFQGEEYSYLCYISAATIIADNIRGIVQAPTRMQNKRKVYIITNLVTSLCTYAIAIPLILKGAYVTALPLAGLLSAIIMDFVFWILNHEWFGKLKVDKRILKELLKIGVPLMPTFIVFWIFNSCDKLMISNFLGVQANGLYAVGSKLAHASQILNTAFGGGWSYFIYATMNDEDRVKSNSTIFELMSGIIFLCSMGVFVMAKPIYQLFFTGEYVSGYVVSPYLFCAPLLQMLFCVISDQLLIIKKSWPITVMLLIGAVTNVLLNYVLIPVIGIEGAAIATVVGYLVSLFVCIIVVQKAGLIRISYKCVLTMFVFVAFVVGWKMCGEKFANGLLCIIVYAMIVIYANIDVIRMFINRVKIGGSK